jgi:hypothetical protein
MLRASIITERMKRVTVVGSGFMSRHVEKEILLAANFFKKISLLVSSFSTILMVIRSGRGVAIFRLKNERRVADVYV